MPVTYHLSLNIITQNGSAPVILQAPR